MTISSTVRIAGPYIGSGAATVFPFAFKVFSAAEMQVAKLNTTSNVEIILVLNTDYTVQLNGDQNGTPGGTITLPAVLASGYNLTITSDIANLQPTDLTNQGGFYPEVITDALDRATIQIQQLDQNSRAIKIPLSDGVLDMTTPVVAARQGKYLAFDSLGLPVASVGTGNDSALRTDLADASASLAGSRLSGFRQTGTGATARTVDAKLKDTVSVKDFGAVGDGVTDDTVAIQAAHAAALEVVYPNGVYYLANNATITGSIKMLPNARFKVLATKTLTINAVVVANINQYIFEGNSIAFSGTFGNVDLYADWFGAVADSTLSASPTGTDSGIAINKAIVAANNGATKYGTVILNSGVYLIITPIVSNTAGISIKGSGKYNTILTCNNAFAANTVITMAGSGGPPSSLTGIGVIARTGGVFTAYGIRVNGNGKFVSNVWINGFLTGIELNSTDVFLFDFASELCINGVLITSSDVNISNGTVYGSSAFGILCQGISTNKESVIISNVRSTADTQVGFGITNSSNIIIKGCSAAHVNNSKYSLGGFVISGTSSNITIDSCKSYLGSQSVTASQIGFDITTSGSNILLSSCTSTNFNTGSYVSASGNIIISNCIMENNTLYGIRAINYTFLTITNCLCNYQGTAAVADSGIYVTANAAYQKLMINSNNCSTVGGGTQDYGTRVTCSNATSSGIVSSNINAFNNVANLLIDGANAANITSVNNI